MHYGACPKKLEARYQTIIKVYRDHYGKQAIPSSSQYWSICGRCSYDMGKMEENCEPDQLIKYKLIKPNQFYGVEISPEIYEFNKSCNNEINWFLGDFYDQMVEYSNHNKFEPAIVNADILLMPKCGVEYFSKVMHFLNSSAKNVMLIGNFIMKARHQVATIKDIVNGLEKEPCFQDSMSSRKWIIHNEIYLYNGTGKTRTKMGSVILFKK
jgi:hypothetical protein